ncbi:MAG: glutamate racemase [Bacteroidetes bacterium]|nr:glutamate racemase [Bacteroidota bacterium]
MNLQAPIGIFDSGYGGLTVFRAIREALPQYDYLYLGDNARAPYGSRSFDTIHAYTWQCVQWMFAQHCPLIILACNTASAKALRNIQQRDLPALHPQERVLGVIRPTAEVIGNYSLTGHVGVLGTKGTIQSDSYPLEIAKLFPQLKVYQQACPLWVPIIEAGEHDSPAADYLVEKYLGSLLSQSRDIDTVLLACTHYPLLSPKILEYLPEHIRLISQGDIVASSLADYLLRHPEMDARLSRGGSSLFFTTDDESEFEEKGSLFFEKPLRATHLFL